MEDLKQRIITHLVKVTKQPFLTIGVEQEFFLLEKDKTPVKHKTSQQFIQTLKNFTTLEKATDPNIGDYFESAKDDLGNKIKYDHHPYLFEIETIPAADLTTIQQVLKKCFDNIYAAASKLNLIISFDPILHIATDQPETLSDLQFRKNLINYRRKLFMLRNEQVNEALINYAAGIISTQIHIGGIPFEIYNNIFQKLYDLEPQIIQWAKSKIKSHISPDKVIEHRNEVYTKTFSNSPVVCFPPFEWTTQNWLNALLNTPLYGSAEEYFSAHTLHEFPKLLTINELDFLYRVRDLQWIKPHRQGTIEFRSIPSLPDISSIMELCEIRLNTIKELV